MKTIIYVITGLLLTACYSNIMHSTNETNITILKISDGDTVKAIVNGKKESIRLLEIDCYETSKNKRAIWQSEYFGLSIGDVIKKGNYSKEQLKKLLENNKEVKLEWSKRDKYKRILGKIYLDNGLYVNEYMLNNGGCEKYIERRKSSN